MGLIWIFIAIGGGIGGYLPMLFGADGLSAWSIIGGTAGSLIGLWLHKRLDLE